MKLGHTAFLRIFALVGIAAVSVTGIPASADVASKKVKTASSLSFTAQCPELLKQADDFANDCLAHAREQVRYFHPAGRAPGSYGEGIKEARKAYFKEALPGSHFSLGCAVDSGLNQIYFLGVYYAAKDSTFKAANSAAFRYIDPRGDVGVWVDENPVNLLAVRQFDTKGHPLTNWKTDRIKNCETSDLPNGEIHTLNKPRFWISPAVDKASSFKICDGSAKEDEGGCQTLEYQHFFPSADQQFIYTGDAFLWLMTSGGDLWIKKYVYQNACWPAEHRKRNLPNIAQEVCDLLPK